MAERVGFEPTMELPPRRISSAGSCPVTLCDESALIGLRLRILFLPACFVCGHKYKI